MIYDRGWDAMIRFPERAYILNSNNNNNNVHTIIYTSYTYLYNIIYALSLKYRHTDAHLFCIVFLSLCRR
jgi:hypothetical protein